MSNITHAKKILPYRPVTPGERISTWEKVRGMWKGRKPDPIKELKKIRSGWDKN